MRISHFSTLSLAVLSLMSSSCSRRSQVDEESKVRTRMESFESQLDAQGNWQYDRTNGERAFTQYCLSCHESAAPLRAMAKKDLRRFWLIANFGDKHLGMKGVVDQVPYHDIVDLTGYALEEPVLTK